MLLNFEQPMPRHILALANNRYALQYDRKIVVYQRNGTVEGRMAISCQKRTRCNVDQQERFYWITQIADRDEVPEVRRASLCGESENVGFGGTTDMPSLFNNGELLALREWNGFSADVYLAEGYERPRSRQLHGKSFRAVYFDQAERPFVIQQDGTIAIYQALSEETVPDRDSHQELIDTWSKYGDHDLNAQHLLFTPDNGVLVLTCDNIILRFDLNKLDLDNCFVEIVKVEGDVLDIALGEDGQLMVLTADGVKCG